MTLLALVASLAFAGEPSLPPQPSPSRALTEVAFGTGFGFMPLDLSSLNDSLSAAGHPRVGTFQLTSLSVNAELWIGRMIPGFDSIGWSNAGAEKAGDTDTTFTFSMSELSFGYAAIYKTKFNLEPRIGFALADTNLVIHQTSTVNLTSDLPAASRALNLHRQDMMADVGLGVGWMIPLTKVDVDGIGTGLRIAFRMGGLIQLFHTSGWKADGLKVDDMPNMYLAGPYLRLFVSPSLLVRYPKVHRVKPSKAHPAVDELVAPTVQTADPLVAPVAPVEAAPVEAGPVEAGPVEAAPAPTPPPAP